MRTAPSIVWPGKPVWTGSSSAARGRSWTRLPCHCNRRRLHYILLPLGRLQDKLQQGTNTRVIGMDGRKENGIVVALIHCAKLDVTASAAQCLVKLSAISGNVGG